MTYAELAELIGNMTPEQKKQDVTVYVRGVNEFYAVTDNDDVLGVPEANILDDGHYYLVI